MELFVWTTLLREYECKKRTYRKRRNDQTGRRKRSQEKKVFEADGRG